MTSLIDIRNFTHALLDSVVYDHADERLVNNANSERDFSVHIRLPDAVIDKVREDVMTLTVSKEDLLVLTQILDRLFDIVNSAPGFTGDEHGREVPDLFTYASFVRTSSSGKRLRLEIDTTSESKTLIYETPSEEGVQTSTSSDEALDYEEVKPDDAVGRHVDCVIQIAVQVDDESSEACFSAFAEEIRLLPRESQKEKRTKRRPVLLSSVTSSSSRSK
jgi:hypothetical protein